MTPAQEIRRFLATGDYDMVHAVWPGRHALERIQTGDRALRVALADALSQRRLLNIAFAKREVFAYACEAYSRILERSKCPADCLWAGDSPIYVSRKNTKGFDTEMISRGDHDAHGRLTNCFGAGTPFSLRHRRLDISCGGHYHPHE